MAKPIPNQLDRSRPSSRLQPQGLLETTPILFRLPSVQVHPLPMVEDLPPTAFQLAQAEVSSPVATEPVAPPVSIVSQPTVATEERQSWWEHWSSGIVLIVLLVALYITSILVLKSRSHKPTNTLAEQKTDFGDLASIELPQITSVVPLGSDSNAKEKAELTVSSISLESSADTNARAEELVGSLSGSLDTPATDLTASHTSAEAEGLANRDSNASTELPAVENSTDGNSLTLGVPLATAQLLEPTQLRQSLPSQSSGSSTSGSGSVSAQSVSSPIGQSPTLYDGAASRTESQATVAVGSNLGVQPGFESALSASIPLPTLNGSTLPSQSTLPPLGGQLPAYSKGYSSSATASIPNVVSGASQQGTVASTVSSQQSSVPIVAGSASASSGSGTTAPRFTSTPDANGEVEAIIKAYLELMRAGQAAELNQQQQTTTAPANRYQPTR